MADDNQACLTVYTLIGKPERVKDRLTARFEEMAEGVDSTAGEGDGVERVVIRLRDGTEVVVHVNTGDGFIRQHIGGMQGFFARADCDNKELRQSVLRQIQVFNCVVGCSFEMNDDTDRTNYIVNTMFAVAGDINGIVLMPDMRLLCPDGSLLYSAEGKSDLTEYVPIGNADFIDGPVEESPADVARRERSIAALEEKGIPYLPQLPAAKGAGLRQPEEIAQRLLAMFGVCVYCEARVGGETWEESQKYLRKIDRILGGLDGRLTARERAFLAVKKPEQRDLANFGWRYECCHVLMWALGLRDGLGYPDRTCDVSGMGGVIWKLGSLAELMGRVRPRTEEEALDAADLILRYDWACVDARVNRLEAPAGLDDGVVVEWHHALNWLIGWGGGADWEDVKTHT
ncbi:MAG: DUF4272 domain-containing protein [Methanomassiliicoccaceae archaeon]|nr:DUF4272 domain-containing protein [Methanomassiliicoccaceae archaeon]